MRPSLFISFSDQNIRLLKNLVWLSLAWGLLVVCCSWAGRSFAPSPILSAGWLAVQLYAAGRLFIPAQALEPVPRQRFFYLFWMLILVASNGCLFYLFPYADSNVWAAALKSALLLLSGTLVGVVLARYIETLREVLLVCVAMSVADFVSWFNGPTAQFAKQISAYYQAPQGMPPLIDVVLIKMAFPGAIALVPVVGVSDWVMVSFFVCVAGQFQQRGYIATGTGENTSMMAARWERYLPVPVIALYGIILVAQSCNLFIPVLPVLAVIMVGWYFVGQLCYRR